MALKTSEVYRCLEKKTLIFGFEILDLFLVFVLLSLLNVLFKEVPYKFLFTWGPSLLLGLTLRLSKRGKPENYLLHLARFQLQPKVFSAFFLSEKRVRFHKKGQK